MEVKHDESRQEFYVELEGHRAHVSYKIHDEGLDIRHTIVPEAIGGKGIASALVQAAYDYGRCKGLKAIATCSYAVVWLQRHPEYQGEVSSDYIGKRVCQNAYPLFFMTKPRLSQAEALLLPKDFVSLNISKVIWQRYIFVLTIPIKSSFSHKE